MAQCGGNPSRYAATKPTERDLQVVADRAGNNWSRLLTSLDIPWATIEKMRAESPTNLWEACMKGLVLWLKEGARDSIDPVTFGTLFAALRKSEMADCVSVLMDWLDERSTPHPRPTHEDEDEDLSTPTSERGKQPTVIMMNELLQVVRMTKEQQSRMGEELALLRREQDKAGKDNLEQGSVVGSEKGKATLLQEKDTLQLLTQLLEENERLQQEISLLPRAHQKPSSAEKPASSSSPVKPFKPEQNNLKVFRSDLVRPGEHRSVKMADLLIPTYRATPVTIGRDVYLAGGVTGEVKTDKLVQVYNMDSGDCRTLPPSPQYNSEAVAIDGTLVLIGGCDSSTDMPTNMVSTWMAAEERWTQDLPPMKMKRHRPGVLLLNKHLFVFGGMGEDGETRLDSFEVLDLNIKQWSIGRGGLPRPLHSPQLGVFGDYVMLCDGDKSAGSATSACYKVPVQVLVDSGDSNNLRSPPLNWTPVQVAPYYRSSLLTTSQDAVLIGGERDRQATGAIHRFSSSGYWEVIMIGKLSEPRSRPAVVPVSDRSFLVLGGYSDPKNVFSSQLKSVEIISY